MPNFEDAAAVCSLQSVGHYGSARPLCQSGVECGRYARRSARQTMAETGLKNEEVRQPSRLTHYCFCKDEPCCRVPRGKRVSRLR